LAEYRTSRRVNNLCAYEIDEAVTAGWGGMHVAPDAVKQVLERFGPERVSYVLANIIQQRDGAGGFLAQTGRGPRPFPCLSHRRSGPILLA